MEELNQIIDPCSVATALPAGMVDMGLVRSLTFVELSGSRVHAKVKLCITHPFCMMSAVFINEVQKRLRTFSIIETYDVSLDEAVIWTEELFSPEYKKRLDAQRAIKRLA
jgi:metal-sulfur cluster biosynthetic enzyme